MPDDKLIPSAHEGGSIPAPFEMGDLGADGEGGPWAAEFAPAITVGGKSGPDLGRYLDVLRRRKWILVLSVIVGLAGAAVAWKEVQVQYTVEGHLWIQVESRQGAEVAPIQLASLLESNAWIDLLRSYAVLDSVVIEHRLYLRTAPEYAPAFEDFTLANRFLPEDYRLTTSEDGNAYTLATRGGAFLERGELGDSIGRAQGFLWAPEPRTLPAGAEIDFSVVPPRDASNDLKNRLTASIDPQGNWINLALKGTNPEKITSILNGIMERHVALAAQLKRSKLDSTVTILEAQLKTIDDTLQQASNDLESFRVRTITLPTDEGTPIAPGLESTRGPVFNNYFQMKVDLDLLRRDRERLAVLADSIAMSDSVGATAVRIEALEDIPAAHASTELMQNLDELVDLRGQLRVLRDRYADSFNPIQILLTRIRTLERVAIPRIVAGILAEQERKEQQLRSRVDSASTELAAIPPRMIEEKRLERLQAINEALYSEVKQRLQTAQLAAKSAIPDITILDRAEVPLRPTDDNRPRAAGIILFGILGVTVAALILLDRVDPRVRYPTEVSREIGLEILGSIPRIRSGGGARGEENAAQVLEAFRELRLTLNFAYGTAGPLTLAITSPAQGEGKSLISTNLAVAFAEVGRRTLLIDGDTRRGDAHRLLGLPRTPGLTDYLRNRSSGDVIQSTDYERLHFIGSGSRSASTPELLASARMASFLGTLKRAYDVILVDCPPLAAGGDAVLLSALTGNMALVIRTGSTEKPLTVAKLEGLARLPIRILGAILNDVDPTAAARYYYASYLPGYEAGREEEEEEALPGAPPSALLADVSSGEGQAS